MAVNGVRMFRYALIAEATVNLASVFPMLVDPGYILSWLVETPEHITPAACSLVQWVGCVVAGLTVPLILAVPHTPEAPIIRKVTYQMYAAAEMALGTAIGMQYLKGDSGLKTEALWSSMTTMAALVAVRVYFLVINPATWRARRTRRKCSNAHAWVLRFVDLLRFVFFAEMARSHAGMSLRARADTLPPIVLYYVVVCRILTYNASGQ